MEGDPNSDHDLHLQSEPSNNQIQFGICLDSTPQPGEPHRNVEGVR